MNKHWPISEMRLIENYLLGWMKLHILKGQYIKPQERVIGKNNSKIGEGIF